MCNIWCYVEASPEHPDYHVQYLINGQAIAHFLVAWYCLNGQRR